MANWVLVVDDHRDSRDTLIDLFASAGFIARGASGVVEALKTMSQGLPSLVVTDFLLDDRLGTELVLEAQKLFGPSLPAFVVLTGWPASEITGLPSSIPILRKPQNIDVLLNIVASHCSRSSEFMPPATAI